MRSRARRSSRLRFRGQPVPATHIITFRFAPGEVQKKLTAALREQQAGGAVPLQKETLGPFLHVWLTMLEQKGRKERTIEGYRWLVEKHIEPELGTIPLTRLAQRDLNAFMDRKGTPVFPFEPSRTAVLLSEAHSRVLRKTASSVERSKVVGSAGNFEATAHRAAYVSGGDVISVGNCKTSAGGPVF